jgi:hypothetical protein
MRRKPPLLVSTEILLGLADSLKSSPCLLSVAAVWNLPPAARDALVSCRACSALFKCVFVNNGLSNSLWISECQVMLTVCYHIIVLMQLWLRTFADSSTCMLYKKVLYSGISCTYCSNVQILV